MRAPSEMPLEDADGANILRPAQCAPIGTERRHDCSARGGRKSFRIVGRRTCTERRHERLASRSSGRVDGPDYSGGRLSLHRGALSAHHRAGGGRAGTRVQGDLGGVLSPLAIIFALLVGFLSAQVWNDADRASSAVNREAGALRAAVLLASGFPGEPEARLRGLIHQYIQDAVTQEWLAMARGNATLTIAPPRLAEALRQSLSLTPRGEGHVAAQREMVASLQSALESRRQRIILSRSSINWVKWTVLLVQGGSYPGHHRHGAQRQPHREPHHPGDLRHRRGGRGRADRVPQPPVHRGDLCAAHRPAPGDAGGRPGGSRQLSAGHRLSEPTSRHRVAVVACRGFDSYGETGTVPNTSAVSQTFPEGIR